jgi:hypothetical protein
MKPKRIGSFDMGSENVCLTVTDGIGGEFATNPMPEIWIGIRSEWVVVMDTLLHEVIEFAAFRARARFSPDHITLSDHTAYSFFFDHTKFSDICARAALFITPALPVLQEAWHTYHNPPLKRKR